jgi:hypothetical protein
MAVSRGAVTQPTAKSNGNQPKATGHVASKGRGPRPVTRPQQKNIRSR